MALSTEEVSGERRAAVCRLMGFSSSAYRLALHVIGSPDESEDIVQQAYLEAIPQIRSGSRFGGRAWFLKIVSNLAKDRLKREARRKKREEIVGRRRWPQTPANGDKGDLLSALRMGLATLDTKYRLPLALCYQEEMTQREAAAVLEMPERTVSKYVNAGLEKLRKALERAGYPAAVAAVLGGLKQTAPTVPASLAGRVEALVAQGATVQGSTIGGVASAAASVAKGGLAMKILAGIVLAGAVAGGVAVMGGGGPGPFPAEKPKFPIPIWHPDARWKAEVWAAQNRGHGDLEGPRLEVMWRDGGVRFPFIAAGGPYHLVGYDSVNERIHDINGGSRGYLDGPLSRARIGGVAYAVSGIGGLSPDGRYYIMHDAYNQVIREIDLQEQVIRTTTKYAGLVAFGENGKAWLRNGAKLRAIDMTTGKTVSEFDLKDDCGPAGCWVIDEAHQRAYCCGEPFKRDGKNWFVWYLDLDDGGKFHGVLAGTITGPCMSYAGPFDGYKGYPQPTIQFGPGDPEKRFLYMNATDTSNFMRLDLEKRIVAAFSFDGKTRQGMFIDSGNPGNMNYAHAGPAWLPNGDFMFHSQHNAPATIYTRIK